jgi:hypothetical protein
MASLAVSAQDNEANKANRRRPGRPPAEIETVQVTVRLRPDQLERLKSLTAKKRTVKTSNVSAIVRMAIDEFFAR